LLKKDNHVIHPVQTFIHEVRRFFLEEYLDFFLVFL